VLSSSALLSNRDIAAPANKGTANGWHLDAPGDRVHEFHIEARVDDGNADDQLWLDEFAEVHGLKIGPRKPAAKASIRSVVGLPAVTDIQVATIGRLLVMQIGRNVVCATMHDDGGGLCIDADETLAGVIEAMGDLKVAL
jgi:hypothetical protein